MRHNIWVKLAAVVLSVALWLFVLSKGHMEVMLEVPIIFENVPQGLVVSSFDSDKAMVVVKGHVRFLKKITPKNVRLALDMSRLRPGRNVMPLDASDVELPITLSAVNLKPSIVTVETEEVQMKTVPLRAALKGQPKAGFTVAGVEVVPGTVSIKGPKSAVGRVSYLETATVDISGAASDFAARARIEEAGKNISVPVDSAEVKVSIRKEAR